MFGLEKIYFQLILLGVFVVATLVGYKLINKVPSLLHTPLMSGMNALSGITVLGALTAAAVIFNNGTPGGVALSAILGVIAIALAMINVVGGFMVTDRMLGMIAKDKAKGQTAIYVATAVVAAGIIATVGCFTLMGANTQWAYLALAILLSLGVLLGIAFMGNVKYSKIGNRFSAVCMLLAIILTIIYNGIGPVWTLYIGLAIGAVFGIILAKKVTMIQMPQMVALLNGLGGAASAVVGGFAMAGVGAGLVGDYFSTVTSSLALAVGMITLIGSLVAAGKLHRILPQKPVVLKGHQLMTVGSLVLTVVGVVVFAVLAGLGIGLSVVIPLLIVFITLISSFFGFIFAIRVGGADMPITISLLNSFSGVAGAIAGLAVGDLLLVAIGGIVGASGLLLTQIMCKAMNRKLIAILTGATSAAPSKKAEETSVKQEETKEEAAPAPKKEINHAATLVGAKEVIIVPGYGMAIAQAQHLVKQVADKLRASGTTIKYAIHPVAGRMPGHMNVLLCEADVDYEDLYEMDDINPEFANADATIVVGANDVLNPAANTAEGTPIYGMPVLNVSDCKNIFIFNYDTKPGYAGVDNPIYAREDGVHMYLGNAADSLQTFLADMDKPVEMECAEENSALETAVEVNHAAELVGAKEVIIVPGYGMAIAQAQHLVKQVADKLRANGTTIKYAIHPVAGRMPGHMNVLLCEADVDYEDLYEMDDINPEFANADATIVVGANDVLNPAANTAEGTPIYGMPVLNVSDCKNIFIFNYDMKPGYAGVENPLYAREEGVHMYLGNAADSLQTFLADMDKPATVASTPQEVKEEKAEFKPTELLGAKEVIIVPGYGMAIAQAQHLVKQVADKLRASGTTIKYAIHPVAGRMPGHMNVLLCEADVDYEDLYEMDDINPEFANADATIVVGANDVLNPAANTAEGTPIYGMPVLNVSDCKDIFIFNYDTKPGYAGVDNPLYTRENGVHLYLGNAQETLQSFLNALN